MWLLKIILDYHHFFLKEEKTTQVYNYHIL